MSLTDRRIAILSTGRQDFGILRSTIDCLGRSAGFDVRLWIGGMHLKDRFGRSVELVKDAQLQVARELDFLHEPPDPTFDAAAAVASVGVALRAERPDALLLVGDRSETLGAAVAATVERIPIVHLHGGEESEGAIDNAMRHAVTKLSHLHLVSHPEHARRVRQMGEDPKCVMVVGAPGLDNMYRKDLPGREELARELALPMQTPVVLVTVHPTTIGGDAVSEVAAVATALESVPATYVITQPNADAQGTEIRDFWLRWREGRSNVRVVDVLGERRYWGLLRIAAAVLGNSSSGIIEAPSAGVPSVNVGDRQQGRLRHPATVDVPPEHEVIARKLREAIAPEARKALAGSPALYPKGPAAPRIVEAIRSWKVNGPQRKRFHWLS